MKSFLRTAGAIAALVLALPTHAGLTPVVVVSPTTLNQWTLANSHCAGGASTGTPSFVAGPGTPPLGTGSAQIAIGADGNSFVGFRTPQYNGQLLSQLTQLAYSTYTQVDGSGDQSPYLLLNLDFNGDGTTDDQIFFEPVYQSAAFFPSNPQGPLVDGTWQTWNALDGGWWSLNGTGGATPGTGVKSLATIIAAQPTATLAAPGSGLGSIRIMGGCGAGAWDNYVGNFDNVTIGFGNAPTTFDFEQAPPAQPDVTVTKTGPTSAAQATNISYTITVANAGTADAANVTLADPIPANTTFQSLAAPAGWTCTTPAVGGTGTVSCTNPLLAAGASSVFTLVVRVDQFAPPGAQITNTATASTTTTESNAANNAGVAAAVVGLAVPGAIPAASPFALVLLAIALSLVGLAALRRTG